MRCNDEQLKFNVFIINHISQSINKPTAIVYNFLVESGVLDEYVIDCYDSLHTLGREHLVEDITRLLHEKGFAL